MDQIADCGGWRAVPDRQCGVRCVAANDDVVYDRHEANVLRSVENILNRTTDQNEPAMHHYHATANLRSNARDFIWTVVLRLDKVEGAIEVECIITDDSTSSRGAVEVYLQR